VGNYESDFIGLDRSIIGRAGQDIQNLANNVPGQLNIEQGSTQFWTFPKQSRNESKAPSTLGLPSSPLIKVVDAKLNENVLYISLTTCLQPTSKTSSPNGPPGQLELYVSTSSTNTQPSAADKDYVVAIVEGFGSLNVSFKDHVYFGIVAPNTKDFTGVFNYQLTASIDGFFASYSTEPNVNLIDSDTSSVLLYTNGIASNNTSTSENFKQWMSGPPRFSIFVQNNDNPTIQGMRRSVCALQNFADIRSSADIDTGMTLAGDGWPKQQFRVRNLNASSTYYAITIVGNSTNSSNGVIGGGGTVWDSNRTFTTKSGTLLSDP